MPRSPLADLRATFFLPARLLADGTAPVHGVVLDVPLEDGVDTLAAYADGTARYINHSGRTIIWEVPDAGTAVRPLVDQLLATSAGLLRYVEPAGWTAPAAEVETAQVTVLVPAGLATLPLVNNQLSHALFSAGAALMNALLERTLESGPPAPIS